MNETTRLYYTDARLTDFTSQVEAIEWHATAGAICLEATAFYPTSGGQPHDTGSMGDQRVVDVVVRPDGRVWHHLDAVPAVVVGDTVSGTVDWARRFDHMQQHTGQHVLSAELVRLFDARTVGFHLGADAATIDLDRPLSVDQVSEGESAANAVAWDDRPIEVRFVTAQEAAQLDLRKPLRRAGRIRLVEIAGCDLSACGGTHVGRSGAVGVVAVSSCDRYKGGSRVGFVCGGRALRLFRQQHQELTRSGQLLSVGPDDLASAIERNQRERRDQRRLIKSLQTRVVSLDADALAVDGRSLGSATLVIASLRGHDPKSLKAVALEFIRRPGHVAVLATDRRPVGVVVARAPDVVLHAGDLVQALLATWPGRGGGRHDVAQAGGLDADPADVLRAARSLLSELLSD